MSQAPLENLIPSSPIAIVGMGCWLPGASDPRQLWENVLARRREFRRMPDGRTPLSDYYDETGTDPDKFYQSKVAVIDGFLFDWASYRIPESSYSRTDVSQWLALEIAHRALKDAGFSRASVPKDRTGVFIGNTCTGEDMRSNSLRLRWPVVRRAMAKAAESQGIASENLAPFMKATEDCYKSIFPEVNEDFVAGSISATIAGRICNYFDFHGGGFVVDGACASSLATVITAANLLSSNDLDLALAGGVDISLDPFELVGFSRNGALSKGEIRPYDRRGDGFIAGEGGGIIVLKRLADAQRAGDAIYAVIRGWGIASDGKAGIMQPVGRQQATAIRRAVDRAGCDLDQLDFVEGHGTGTRAGDRTEIEGLSLAMAMGTGASADEHGRTCGIGSLKSLIGHTKATAGVASLIKAVAAVNRRAVPPTASCEQRNDAFDGVGTRLFPIGLGEVRDPDAVMRAGVSAFGFGGINTHLIIESGGPPSPRLAPQVDERSLLVSHQESELFVFGGNTKDEVIVRVDAVAIEASLLSPSDLVDLAAALSNELPTGLSIRCAVIAESPDDLAAKLAVLRDALTNELPAPNEQWATPRKDVLIAHGTRQGRIGFLFPGQGSHQLLMARTLIERFDWARRLAEEAERAVPDRSLLDVIYRPIDRARDASEIDGWTALLSETEVAQPAICLASVLCSRYLASLGIRPAVVGGHSLGEITALHVAGAFSPEKLFSIASIRGQVMRAAPDRAGGMASLACARKEAENLLAQLAGTVVVANINSPNQTVVSGDVEAIDAVVALAATRNILSRRLPVSNAFHSPLVAHSAEAFESALDLPESLPSLTVPVVSGVESASIDGQTDLRRHLARQITNPVNFIELAKSMKGLCDVFIEVGPGRTLSGLCRDIFNEDGVCTPLAADALKWNPNQAVAVAFLNGVDINWPELYAQRLVRGYTKPSQRIYLSNPAERPIALQSASLSEGQSTALANEHVLGSTLGRELGLNAQHLTEYLRHRGKFLAGVARLDMASLAGSAMPSPVKASELTAILPAPVSARQASQGIVADKTSVEKMIELLIELTSQRTGYPGSSITAESRLLDDLNLDSIKAGELVGEALRRVGAAGAIDATRFANSSLRDIATALHGVAPESAEAVPVIASPTQGGDAVAAGETSVDAMIDLLVQLTSQRTGYPGSSITAESRLLDDLNLDSIKAGDLVAEALRRIGAAGAIDATRFANSSLWDIATALYEVLPSSQTTAAVPASSTQTTRAQPAPLVDGDLSFVSRHPTWTRNFVVRAEPRPRAAAQAVVGQRGDASLANAVFLVFFEPYDRAPADALLAEIIARGGRAEMTPFGTAARAALQRDSRFTHQIAVLPRVPSEGTPPARLAEMISRVTSVAQAPLKSAPRHHRTTVGYVQFGGGFFGNDATAAEPELCNALAFARTLHLEREDLRVRVLDFAESIASETIAGLVLDEVAVGEPFAAVGFDATLTRRVPVAALSEPVAYQPRPIVWSERDVILVTGGAKGILAECALGIARETGATLVLVGRGESSAAAGASADGEIDRTLERFRSEGLRHRYHSCNIVDPVALAELVEKVEAQVGPITGVIHGASILRPCRADGLTVEGVLQEVSPKVLGAWNLCRALNGRPLKLFVAFSSLVVDHGMPWSSGYAFANEVMERVVQTCAVAEAQMPLQIVSFGLWGNVGRPAVLKTNDHLLSVGLHDGEIPPEEGVRRFVEAFMFDPGVQRLCVYGRSVGYATWGQLRPEPAIPTNLRFIERVLHVEPEVELVARCRLTLQRDRFLHDHVYNGMYIVPTVFSLEAIAQAAHALMGDAMPLCRLDGVEMPYPIVVDPNNGLEIELRAEVQPETSADGFRRINVSIATEQTGFRTSALSGTVVFGKRRVGAQEPVELGLPVPINAREDLYGRQFFVGPMYQRMGVIHSVDPKNAVCIGEMHGDKDAAREAFDGIDGSRDDLLVLGDPFFRDTLLHTSLLHHLEHMAFTSRIDKIELFEGSDAAQAAQRLCIARLGWSGGKDAEFELMAASMNGQVFERWTGFCSKALARSAEWPSLQDLLDVGRTNARDERTLSDSVVSGSRQVGVVAPFVALECVSGFARFPREERHVHERALATRAVASVAPGAKEAPGLLWLPTGRPRLEAGADLDISFSHEGPYCMCVVGSDAQGCDLAAISPRSQAEWHSLFGSARAPLLASLSADEPLDTAGTRIWAALEAARKAVATDNEEVTVLERREKSVLFRVRTPDKDLTVLTLPLRLSRGPQIIVALTVKFPHRLEESSAASSANRWIVRDERLGCDVLEHELNVSWKECTTPSRKVMPAYYVDWFHRTREVMLPPQVARRLVAGVLDGTAGLVARSIHVQLHDDVTAHDELRARIWMTTLSESAASWRVDFSRKLPQGAHRLVATVEAQGGVVGATGAGGRSREASTALRDYDRFVQTHAPASGPDNGAGFAELGRGQPVFEMTPGPRGGPVLHVETMRPSLVDSDLVGNVSSISFFGWLAHVRDRFLHSVVPNEMIRRVGRFSKDLGEVLCIDEEMTYLREAFPFDEITVEMSLLAATDRSARMRYEFLRKKEGITEKIAIGHHQLVWVHRTEGGHVRSEPFPAKLLTFLASLGAEDRSDADQICEVKP